MTSATLTSRFLFLLFILSNFFISSLWISFLRWSLWGRLVKAEEGCTLSVSFFKNLNRFFSRTNTLVCTIYLMKHNAWMLFLTRVSDLHRALANLARATLESVVQERWVCVLILFTCECLIITRLLLICLLWIWHQIWIPISTHLPSVAKETSPGTEAGGGFCHDSSQRGQRYALHAAFTEPRPTTGKCLAFFHKALFRFFFFTLLPQSFKHSMEELPKQSMVSSVTTQ